MIDRFDKLDGKPDLKKEVYFIDSQIAKMDRLLAKARKEKKKKADKKGYGGLLNKLKGDNGA